MAKFIVTWTVENPNCLYYERTITAENEEEAEKKAAELDEEIDFDTVDWQVSDGNSPDVGDRNYEVDEE